MYDPNNLVLHIRSDYHSPAGHLLAFAAWGQWPGSLPAVAPGDVNDLVITNLNCPLLLEEELGP